MMTKRPSSPWVILGSTGCVLREAIRAYAKHHGWPMEKIAVTIDWLGNTIAASIPATLYDVIRQGRIEPGDKVLPVGTGAGLSAGGAIITH
jgi:3-oxoacyl-[acyl-carrier-protein] synthase III